MIHADRANRLAALIVLGTEPMEDHVQNAEEREFWNETAREIAEAQAKGYVIDLPAE